MNVVLIISVMIVVILSIAGFQKTALFEGSVPESALLVLLGFSLFALASIGRRLFFKRK